MNILYVNATISRDSRTERLACYTLNKLDGDIKEVDLTHENIPHLNMETLEHRTSLV